MDSEKKCPKPQWLKRLINGEVTAEQEAKLSRHLDQCQRCQAELDRLNNLGLLKPDGDTAVPPGETWKGDEAFQGRLDRLRRARPMTSKSSTGFDDVLPWLEEQEGKLGRIAEFDLVKFLGRGGMGVVFEAFDNKLHRHVALKMMSPGMIADPNASARFLREARAAAKINHVNVVTIHRVDETRGLPYLVMELIDGRSIEDQLEKSPNFPVGQILKIAKQTAMGLGAAHRHGITHRDIKPSNLMLDRKSKRIKIADFGLAATINETSFTQSGMLVGTPDFASPEQISAKNIDARSDLFSLGCVLYYLCSGQKPFAADSMIETLDAVRHKDLPRVDGLNGKIPSGLASIIEQLLQKDPEDRFQTADELCQAIDQFAKSPKDPHSHPDVSNRELSTAVRIAVPAGILVLLACMAAFAIWRPRDPSPQSADRQQINETDADTSEKTEATVELDSGTIDVSSSEELISAIDNSTGDLVINLTAEIDYVIDHEIRIHDRSVTIKGDPEARPNIELAKTGSHPAIHIEEGILELNGVRLEDLSDVESDESLILCEHGELLIRNCLITSTARENCLSVLDCDLEITDSILQATDTLVSTDPSADRTVRIDNSILVSLLFLEVEDSSDPVRIVAVDSDFLSWHAFGIQNVESNAAIFSLDANRCRFVSQDSMFHFQSDSQAPGEEAVSNFFAEHFFWLGRDNIAPMQAASWSSDEADEEFPWPEAGRVPKDTILQNMPELSVEALIEELRSRDLDSVEAIREALEELAEFEDE